jgi:hypothetical protein
VKRAILWVGSIAAAVAFGVWVANNTHWADVTLPTPLKGEALRNPFYAAQHLADQLGAQTSWRREMTLPPQQGVLVLSAWNWGVAVKRRQQVERWVEAGGRLVVDSTLVGGEDAFEEWSGIAQEYREPDSSTAQGEYKRCRTLRERSPAQTQPSQASVFVVCDLVFYTQLTTERNALWTLGDDSGTHVIRVGVGRGSVTVINASPFRYRDLFEGAHGALFVAATQLRRGDAIVFLSENDYPSLVALVWNYGAPVVVCAGLAIALLLWRGAVRFGPLAAAPQAARRSLAEQIRGTGKFLVRQGGAESLHGAAVRALDEAAETRVRGYLRAAAQERAATLARLTGFDAGALTTAIHHPHMRRPHELRRTIALLEAARRLIITERRRSPHGRH